MAATAGYLGAAAIGLDKLDELVVGAARDTHHAIARRSFVADDLLARGVAHKTHDAIAGGVYAVVGGSLRWSAKALRRADRGGVGPRLEDGTTGMFLLAAVNGLIGDRLREEHPELALDFGVRVEDRDVDHDGISGAFPDATGSLVIFVHGLCESETVWAGEQGYAAALAARGWTPVHLRVNTGLSIGENGVALASLIDRLVADWPLDVRRIALVGHSMGGLIIRAAGAVADQPRTPWRDLVTNVVTLATPHLGAPLERLADRGARALGLFPESAAFGRILDHRSRGILDLRHGLPRDAQRFANARYHLVAGSLTRSPRHPVALTVGDLLVPPRSALGRYGRSGRLFPGADSLFVPGAGHFGLLNHPEVGEAIEGWLGDAPPDEPRDHPARERTAQAAAPSADAGETVPQRLV